MRRISLFFICIFGVYNYSQAGLSTCRRAAVELMGRCRLPVVRSSNQSSALPYNTMFFQARPFGVMSSYYIDRNMYGQKVSPSCNIPQRSMSTAPSWWTNPFTYRKRLDAYKRVQEQAYKSEKRSLLQKFFPEDVLGIEYPSIRMPLSLDASEKLEIAMSNNPKISAKDIAAVFDSPEGVYYLMKDPTGTKIIEVLEKGYPSILTDLLQRLKDGFSECSVQIPYGRALSFILEVNPEGITKLISHNESAIEEIVPGVQEYLKPSRQGVYTLPPMELIEEMGKREGVLSDIAKAVSPGLLDYKPKKLSYFLNTLLKNPSTENILMQNLNLASPGELQRVLHNLYTVTASSDNDLKKFHDRLRFYHTVDPYYSLDIDEGAKSQQEISNKYKQLVYEYNPERFMDENERKKAEDIIKYLEIAHNRALSGEPIDREFLDKIASQR